MTSFIWKDFLKKAESGALEATFAYLEKEGAQAWLGLSQAEGYKNFRQSIEVLGSNKENICKATVQNECLDVVYDLGPGDGQKAAILLEQFSHLLDRLPFYVGFDVSETLLQKALMAVEPFVQSQKEGILADFRRLSELLPSIEGRLENKPESRLFMLLGNTLGNFPTKELLPLVVKCMKQQDFLLIGFQLRPEQGEEQVILNGYSHRFAFQHTFEPLRLLGISREDGNLEHAYVTDPERPSFKRVEAHFKFSFDREVVTPDGKKSFVFKKGQRIPLYLSYKFTKANVETLSEENNLRIEGFYSTADGSYALVLTRKCNQ